MTGETDWRKQFPWTQEYKQNDLFRPHETWELNACVGLNGGPYDLEHYAMGYFRAGRRLVGTLLEDQDSIDVVVYPLVFTYRQALELALKHLADALPRIWEEPTRLAMTHRLKDNWEFVRAYLERDQSFRPKDTVPQADRVLRDFLELDPTGESFRYPSARSGALFLQETGHINVLVFGQAMAFLEEAYDLWRYEARRLGDHQ